jgi:SAM-dependent methyltransferase
MTGPASPTGYVLDQSWYAERERLSSLTSLYDPTTMNLCDRLGLTAGSRCLELGAGTGSIAQLFADRVGASGDVLAVDMDTRFIEPQAGGVLTVRRLDVTADPLPSARFDLVHARLLLEHLPRREHVLRSMVSAAVPGGWVLVEDFDWSTAPMIDPPSAAHGRVAEACRVLMQASGYDPFFGRRLPRALAASGLTDVNTHAVAMQVKGDRRRGIPQWELLVAQLRPGLLAAGLVTEADIQTFSDVCHDEKTICFAPLMVSAWGRRRTPPDRRLRR